MAGATAGLRAALPVLSALLLSAGPASAHGGLWRAEQIRVDPGDPGHVVVRSDSWGIVETRDGGKTWGWTCDEPALESSLTLQRRPFAVAPGGNVLVGSGFDGLMLAKGSLCGFEAVTFTSTAGACGTGSCVPYDVFSDSSHGAVLALTAGLGSGSMYVNVLWRSTDGGTTWTTQGASLPSDVFGSGVNVAPSDPRTIYAGAATITAPPDYLLFASHDGGSTWQRTPLPFQAAIGDFPAVVRIHGVHPTDPNLVVVWLDHDSGDRTVKAPDRLFVSTDGGASLREVFQGTSDLPGFTFSADGTAAFLGATDDGLQRATVADLRSTAPTPFVRVNDTPAWGVALQGDAILVGRNDYGAPDADLMSLGLSRDDGRTFTPYLRICDVMPASCPSGTPAGDTCPGLFYGPLNFQVDMQSQRCSVADSGADGGRPPAARTEPSCACSVGRSPVSSAGAIAATLCKMILARLRRRPRRGRSAEKSS